MSAIHKDTVALSLITDTASRQKLMLMQGANSTIICPLFTEIILGTFIVIMDCVYS